MNLLTEQPVAPDWDMAMALERDMVWGLGQRVKKMTGLEQELGSLKQQLLLMASHAESAVNRAVRAILRRDDDLARRTHEDDTVIDKLEVEIDHTVLQLLGPGCAAFELRLLTAVMKIARELERVGDEASTISRRCIKLGWNPRLNSRSKSLNSPDCRWKC